MIERFRNLQKDKAEEIKETGTLMADLVEEHKAIVDKCCRNTKVYYMRNLLSSKVWNRPVHEPGIGSTFARKKGRNTGSLEEQQLSDWSLIMEERLKEKIMNMSCETFYNHLMEAKEEAKLSPRMFDIDYLNFPIWKQNWTNATRALGLSRKQGTDHNTRIENKAKGSALSYWIKCLSEHDEFQGVISKLSIKSIPKSENDRGGYGAAAA
jgi:hypothetical protein